MSKEEDRAVKAARDTVIRETDNGYRVLGAPEKSVTHQHDIDRIPEKDITQEMLSNSGENPEAWLVYGGNYEQHRYTTCEVITPENVADLELEHDMSVGTGSSMEGTPLVVPGDPPIMYQSNGPNHIKAIDPREGDVLWSYTYAVPNDVVLCCDDNNRGPAIYGGKVFMTTLDSGVVALDRYTGEEEWYHSTEDHERGYSATWAPIVYNGTLFTGSAGGEYGVRGFHTAIDTESGDEKWRINVSPEEEWVGDSIEQSSCTNWTGATVDHENGRLYLPTGNPGPDFDGSVRPGPNRNGIGTLCLDIETGEELWFHQESAHDIWDYDSAMPRILIRDVEVRGKTRDVIISVGKTGWLYTNDAETGELLVRSEPLCQQLNMFRMVPHIDEGRRVPFIPGGMGGNDWQPGCYNPELEISYHKLNNSPQEAWWRFEEYEAGKKYWGGILEDETEAVPDDYNGHISVITAVRPLTGEVVWQDWIDSDIYLWGGTMATKTGLMFAGTQNGNLVGYDGESGERLWEFDAGDAPISGDPISWYDPGTEKQYLAIQVGGSGWLRRGERDDRLLVFSMENGIGTDDLAESANKSSQRNLEEVRIKLDIGSGSDREAISTGELGYFHYNLNALYSAIHELMYEYDGLYSGIESMLNEIVIEDRRTDTDFSELLEEYRVIEEVHERKEYHARYSPYHVTIESIYTENPVKSTYSADQSLFLIFREIYIRMNKWREKQLEVNQTEEEPLTYQFEGTEDIDDLNYSLEEILDN